MLSTPVEYDIICKSCDINRRSTWNVKKITQLIESIAYISDNPVFRTPKFRVTLIEFKKYGFSPQKAERWSVKDVLKISKERQEMTRL